MTSTARDVALLVIAGVFAFHAVVRVNAPTGSPSFPVLITRSGTVTPADRKRILEVAFQVPPGSAQIDIDFAHDRNDQPVQFDLGVRGPDGLRGWSEDRIDRIHIDSTSASYGYLPGPLPPGTWSVLIGVATVPNATAYTVTVRVSDRFERTNRVLRAEAGWYAGDLHAHSGHSDGYRATANGGRVPVTVDDLARAADRVPLDFLAITDHNTASHWPDVDHAQSSRGRMVLMHAREITTYEGHFNAIGERRARDLLAGLRRPMADLLREGRAAGAFLSINHPTSPNDDWCMGCGWTNVDRLTLDQADGVEIVNGSTPDPSLAGWRFWASLLNEGHRLVAVGGSDTHDPDGDRPVGSPTTMVFADALSEDALVAGLNRGRVYVRTEGPRGPSLDVQAQNGSRFAEMGGSIPGGRVRLTATIGGATGQECVWVRNGLEIHSETVRLRRTVMAIDVGAIRGDWFSVILRRGATPTAFSNALFVD